MPYFIRNHLGSVRTIVDGSTGDVLETSDYLPFGKRWELTGGQAAQTVTDPTNRWRFSGKETQSFYNPAIPYNDFGARLHDPRTGRWLGVDPLAEKNYSVTPFGYCCNNPANTIDSNGEMPQAIIGAVIGAASEYAAQVIDNALSGKYTSVKEIVTNVDGKSIAVSAAAGAADVGIASGMKKLATTIKAAKAIVESAEIGGQAIAGGISSAADDMVHGKQVSASGIAFGATSSALASVG